VLQVLAHHHATTFQDNGIRHKGRLMQSHECLQPLHKFALDMFLLSPPTDEQGEPMEEEALLDTVELEPILQCIITKESWQTDFPMVLTPTDLASLNNVSIDYICREGHWKVWLNLIESQPNWIVFLNDHTEEYMLLRRPAFNGLLQGLGAQLLARHRTCILYFFFLYGFFPSHFFNFFFIILFIYGHRTACGSGSPTSHFG
jgi:hypothetical protein